MLVKSGKIRSIIFGIGIIITLICVGTISFVYLCSKKVEKRRIHLLCETNWQILLDACRDISKQVAKGSLKPGTYFVRSRNPSSEIFRFPYILKDINPIYIQIDPQGWVLLEMTGIENSGVVAYPDDTRDKYSFRGDVELIPGLWYHDAEYSDEYPNWKKKINALISKGKSQQKPEGFNSRKNDSDLHSRHSMNLGYRDIHLRHFCVSRQWVTTLVSLAIHLSATCNRHCQGRRIPLSSGILILGSWFLVLVS